MRNAWHIFMVIAIVAVVAAQLASRSGPSGNAADGLMEKGKALAATGDHAGAARLYAQALESEPKGMWERWSILNELGMAYYELDDLESTHKYLDQALTLQQDSPELWVHKGISLRASGDFEGAQTCYEKALEINPGDPEAHSSFGSLLILSGKPEEAIPAFEKAISLKPDLAVSHGNMALALAMVGRFEDADKALKQAIALGYANAAIIRQRIDTLKANAGQ